MFKIFIPSKGRADSAKTPRLLQREGIEFCIVVEPSEEKEYRAAFPKVEFFVLPKDNQGIAYVRQFMLEMARTLGLKKYWQMDDNITAFYETKTGRTEKCEAKKMIENIEMVASGGRISLAGPDYQQFAFRGKELYTLNTRVYCCVLTRTDTGCNYDQDMSMKEDVDFCLQHLSKGQFTMLFHRWAMGKKPMGQGKGGLKPLYDSGFHVKQSYRLVRKWPNYTCIKHKPLGDDVKVFWGNFKRLGEEAWKD